MNAWLGPDAKQMRMGQLGYVMETQNPLRVAEEAAVLDHILKGRFFWLCLRLSSTLDQDARPAVQDPPDAVESRV